jgi:hypothetical protein
MHRWPFWISFAVVVTVLLALAFLGALGKLMPGLLTQALIVAPAAPGSVVDLRDFAGAPAQVRRLRISDVDADTVIWDLQASGDWGELSRFPLQPGPNPVLPRAVGGFEAAFPEEQESFVLTAGAEYEVQVWALV